MTPIIVLLLRILMVIALYSFLGWAMLTLWKDLKFQSQIISKKKTPPISIIMDSDPRAERLNFSQNEIIIGRDDSCDIHLPDQSTSGKHARLVYRNMHWWIEDLMSTNGTYLNDERIESPAILINGDELRIGKSILVVEIQAIS